MGARPQGGWWRASVVTGGGWEKPLAAVLLQRLGETLVLTMSETGQGHQRSLRPAKPPRGRAAPKTEGTCTCWWGPSVTELGGLSSGGLGDGGRSSELGPQIAVGMAESWEVRSWGHKYVVSGKAEGSQEGLSH